MCKQHRVRLAGMLIVAAAVTAVVSNAHGATPARMETFATADGKIDFALVLQPAAPAAAAARHVVVLFDTSASQAGLFREDGLTALRDMLRHLDAGDRVQLLAVDLEANPMTEGFVAPAGPEMTAALQKLEARLPLGATDLEKALGTAVHNLAARPKENRAVVYFGQGRSPANIFTPQSLEDTLRSLSDARVPVNACAVGPRIDAQALGVLVYQSGGQIVTPGPAFDAHASGRALAGVVHATVLWPSAVQLPAAITEVFPKNPPPLRSDRETVFLGTCRASSDPLEIKIEAQTATGKQSLSWSAPAPTSSDDNNYLVQLLDVARRDDGLTLPLIDSGSLKLLQRELGSDVAGLVKMAQQAVSMGNTQNAAHLADEVLRRDPNNIEAQTIKRALAREKVAVRPMALLRMAADDAPAAPPAPGAVPPAPGVVPPVPAAGAAPLDLVGAPPPPPAAEGGLVQSVEADRRVRSQAAQADVNNTVTQARRDMAGSAAAAMQSLRSKLEDLRLAQDLPPDVRAQLVGQLQSELRVATVRQREQEIQQLQAQESAARAKEREVVLDNLQRTQEKVKQLLGRFDALIAEGRYRWAEEGPAAEAAKNYPDLPMSIAATLVARTQGWYVEGKQVEVAKQKGFVDTCTAVEKSGIPFPDDVPIVYPDPRVWQELTQRRREKYRSVDLAAQGPAEKRINEQLNAPTQMEFIDTPLNDVIEYLKDLHGIEIQLDKKKLEEIGVNADAPITRSLKGVTLRSALRLILHELDLTYLVDNEVLLITTQEAADAKLKTKVYPVADLVLPIRQLSLPGGMGPSMLNTGGGGGGGGMGGMGGGGMGGMGGGMGGGFNIPPQLLGRALGQNNGLLGGGLPGAFDVPDDLTLLPNGQPRAARPASVQAAPAQPAPAQPAPAQPATIDTQRPDQPAVTGKTHRIQIEIEEGARPDEVWEKYLATHEETPAAIRDAVRRLMDDKKYDHVIALISAAMRHNQAQPWMYEGLALAMEISGRPKADVERALMSAADFAQEPEGMLFLGTYMLRNGMEARALQVFRQVAKAAPERAEPYALGLQAAQRLNDLEATKWATLGILSQAWSRQQQDVARNGYFTAKATLEKLRSSKQTKEAAQYKAALDAAVVRDCRVVVSWTGDAEIDLAVEEPSGAACSFRHPRTVSGGVLVGDVTAPNGDPTGTHTVEYVCPQGFKGDYRVIVSRQWGKVPANKVLVEVTTHYLGQNARVQRQYVNLSNDEAVVKFALDAGRRRESLSDQQVANAIAAQQAVQQALNKQVLGQQMAAAADPTLIGALEAESLINGNSNPFPFLQGAVGYQPNIIMIPEGASMVAQAVVSADRRYVRVTVTPFFSRIRDVYTFNMSTGSSTNTGQGGTGGAGF